jgi:regulator of replication initiation timing
MPDEIIEEKGKEVKQESEKIDYEKIAKSKGWKPKDEFSGEAWIGAEEFVKREPLFEKIKGLKSEVKETHTSLSEMKQLVRTMTETYVKDRDIAVKKAIDELKTQKKEAIETGDVARVEKIDEQIEAQKQVKVDIPKQAEVRPEITTWIGKNKWFDENPKMQKFALSFNKAYASDNPDSSLAEVLEETEKAVKLRYPEEFKNNATRQESASPVEVPSSEGKQKVKGYGRDRLKTDEQRMVYDQCKKHGVYADMTEYVKQLEIQGEV